MGQLRRKVHNYTILVLIKEGSMPDFHVKSLAALRVREGEEVDFLCFQDCDQKERRAIAKDMKALHAFLADDLILTADISENMPAMEKLYQEYCDAFFTNTTLDILPINEEVTPLMDDPAAFKAHIAAIQGETDALKRARIASRETTHTDRSYLSQNYLTFDDIKDEKYDGFIITGAPVEKMPYEEVEYWPEMMKYFEWADTHVFSTLHFCWAAQAGLYRDYGVEKRILPRKLFGIYQYGLTMDYHPLLRGFDDRYFIPQSRHTSIDDRKVDETPELTVLSRSSENGINIISDQESRRIFVLGHFEYDLRTLEWEYKRDREKGLPIRLPENYYPYDDPQEKPRFVWCSYAHLFYHNWLNFVYQETPYSLDHLMPFNVHNPLHV